MIRIIRICSLLLVVFFVGPIASSLTITTAQAASRKDKPAKKESKKQVRKKRETSSHKRDWGRKKQRSHKNNDTKKSHHSKRRQNRNEWRKRKSTRPTHARDSQKQNNPQKSHRPRRIKEHKSSAKAHKRTENNHSKKDSDSKKEHRPNRRGDKGSWRDRVKKEQHDWRNSKRKGSADKGRREYREREHKDNNKDPRKSRQSDSKKDNYSKKNDRSNLRQKINEWRNRIKRQQHDRRNSQKKESAKKNHSEHRKTNHKDNTKDHQKTEKGHPKKWNQSKSSHRSNWHHQREDHDKKDHKDKKSTREWRGHGRKDHKDDGEHSHHWRHHSQKRDHGKRDYGRNYQDRWRHNERRHEDNFFWYDNDHEDENKTTYDYRTFNATVEQVRGDRLVDVRINGDTYNVYTNDRLPQELEKNDRVSIYGYRYGHNDIRNAETIIERREAQTYYGTVVERHNNNLADVRIEGKVYSVNVTDYIPPGLSVNDYVRVVGERYGADEIRNSDMTIIEDYKTYYGTVERIYADNTVEMRIGDGFYLVYFNQALPCTLSQKDTARVYGYMDKNDIVDAEITMVRDYRALYGTVIKSGNGNEVDMRIDGNIATVHIADYLLTDLNPGDIVRIYGYRQSDDKSTIHDTRMALVRDGIDDNAVNKLADKNDTKNIYHAANGVVEEIRDSRFARVRIGGKTYEVYTNSCLPRKLKVKDKVRIYGILEGQNEIDNADVMNENTIESTKPLTAAKVLLPPKTTHKK